MAARRVGMDTHRLESGRSGSPFTSTPWMMSPLRTMPARTATGWIDCTPEMPRMASSDGRWTGIGSPSAATADDGAIRMSPVSRATPSRTDCLNPDETATATMMTRKLTAMEAAASFP